MSFKALLIIILERPEEALRAFDSALQEKPNLLEAKFKKGAVLFELGKYKQSLSAVENVIRINSKYINALNIKSSILEKLDVGEKQDE